MRVNALLPKVAEAGVKLVMAGTGLLTVKVEEPEVPPPGALLKTVTVCVPPVAMSAAVIVAVS